LTIDLIVATSQDDTIRYNPDVSFSESVADHRNAAIAHVLADHGKLVNGIDAVRGQYFAQCAIEASVRTVARSALFLVNRTTAHPLLDSATVCSLNAVLLTSGMYGAAGDIAYRVALPAKSGIGGGILAIMPGVGTICVWAST